MINDFVKHVDELKSSKHNFFINAADWNKISLPVKLNWKKAKFKKSNASSIPKNSGVYAFLISPENDSLPPFAFLMYIGITGYKADSPSTLRDRYMNYIKEEVDLIRPNVHYTLNKYKDNIYFYYAAVDRDTYPLKDIETSLNDALIPPCNINDYSAEMRPKVKAAGL